MDPYYEQMSGYNRRRTNFMDNIFDTFTRTATYRGPGTCQDWDNNAALEPIISNYKRIYPWRPSFVRPDRESDGWIVYNAPRVITDKISVVKVAQYSSDPNKPAPQAVLVPLYSPTTLPPSPPIPNASDLLYCFEGGTGSIAGKTVASWSIMGFVLARE